MPQRINSPRFWRNYAEDTLRIAEQMKDPESKRLLMGVAATYAELATAHRQALQAMEFGRRNNRLVTAFAEIAMPGLTLTILPSTFNCVLSSETRAE